MLNNLQDTMEVLRFSIINIDQKHKAESYQMDNQFVNRKQTGMAKTAKRKLIVYKPQYRMTEQHKTLRTLGDGLRCF